MTRPRQLIAAMSGGLLAAFPPAAAVLLLASGLWQRTGAIRWSWLLVWAGYLLALAVAAWQSPRELLVPALQALFGSALGLFVVIRRPNAVAVGIATVLFISAVAGLLERELSRKLWSDPNTAVNLTDLLAGVSELTGDGPGWTRNGVRLFEKSWRNSSGGALDQVLSFEVRGESRAFGWQWYTNDPGTTQELLHEDGSDFTRLSNVVASVVRRVRTAAPLAGRTVRASVELRSANAGGDPSEVKLALRTFEPSSFHQRSVNVDASWRRYETVFTFPAGARQPTLEFVIGATYVDTLDVRSLHVEEEIAGTWVELGPLEPAGVNVRVPLDGVHNFSQPTLTVEPTADWTRHSLTVPASGVASTTALLQLEAGTTVELRSVRLAPQSGGSEAVAAPNGRTKLLFEQANLAGHTFVACGLLAMLLVTGRSGRAPGANGSDAGRKRRLTLAAVIALTMLAAVIPTGSRAAFFAGGLGAISLLTVHLLRGSARARSLLLIGLTILLIATVGLAALGLGGDVLGRLAFWQDNGEASNQVSRTEIWQTAITGIRAEPVSGWGAGGFPNVWRSEHPEDARAVPQHAHSFWLQLGVTHGVPGLLAALWLSIGVLILSIRSRQLATQVLVLIILLMQLVDFTLTQPGVLLPLVAALNASPTGPMQHSSRSQG